MMEGFRSVSCRAWPKHAEGAVKVQHTGEWVLSLHTQEEVTGLCVNTYMQAPHTHAQQSCSKLTKMLLHTKLFGLLLIKAYLNKVPLTVVSKLWIPSPSFLLVAEEVKCWASDRGVEAGWTLPYLSSEFLRAGKPWSPLS